MKITCSSKAVKERLNRGDHEDSSFAEEAIGGLDRGAQPNVSNMMEQPDIPEKSDQAVDTWVSVGIHMV